MLGKGSLPPVPNVLSIEQGQGCFVPFRALPVFLNSSTGLALLEGSVWAACWCSRASFCVPTSRSHLSHGWLLAAVNAGQVFRQRPHLNLWQPLLTNVPPKPPLRGVIPAPSHALHSVICMALSLSSRGLKGMQSWGFLLTLSGLLRGKSRAVGSACRAVRR